MRQYLVTFHKIVPDDQGHDHRILQRRALVTARSEVAALYEAKAHGKDAYVLRGYEERAA